MPLLAPGSGRPTTPFPHAGNYRRPLDILQSYFWDAEQVSGPGRHNRYLEVPGLSPVLVTRDPAVIRAIATNTGDRPDQFDRDELPSTGIARATGEDTLLFANGPVWKRQRRAAASPFGKTSLFRDEVFADFSETFRDTVSDRLGVLDQHLEQVGESAARLQLDPEICALMLEMLINNFFGAAIPYSQITERYVPALRRVIEHIVSDTVRNRLGFPVLRLPGLTRGIARLKEDYAIFDELTDLALLGRREGRGHWPRFKSDAPDEALKSNLKVFLAGALEATTSYASWAISHLARNAEWQDRVHAEVSRIDSYTPGSLSSAPALIDVLEETLRLTPSLYFLPRRATTETAIETADGRRLEVPCGTHLLLDVWHANRHEDHWGIGVTGYRADEFAPDRWDYLRRSGRGSKELLHFGFGHGPRVCPGKHLGQLETALVVGAFVKLFRFRAVNESNEPVAGVSTKPADGVLIELERR